MEPIELLALAFGLSIATAALAWAGGRLVEGLSADPRLRDRLWGMAFFLPALPPLAVGLMLLAPAPVQEIAAPIPVGAPVLLETLPMTAAAPLASAFAFAPSPFAHAVLIAAGLLAVWRLGGLGVRGWRLHRMLAGLGDADAATLGLVNEAARRMAVRPPRVGSSRQTTEPQLAGFIRARLILPNPGTTADQPSLTVVAHELAHLKRGDHRIVWLEELLVALLAVNPLMPVLRGRRAAAREEACDLLALAGADAETRRAYAESLIEALRGRAVPQPLPALTFTGAGRRTAMRRLKAVMRPTDPAGRPACLVAVVVGLTLMTAAGAAAAAVASHRAVEMRPVESDETRPQARQLLNGAPMPEGLPIWALNPERVEVRTPPAGNGEIDLIIPFTGTTPVSVDGRRLPAGFPVRGINPEAVASLEMAGDHMMVRLKSEPEFRAGRGDPGHAGDVAEATARAAANAEAHARYERASAADYRAYCASGDPRDDGFCAGVMLRQLTQASASGLCVPDGLADDPAQSSEFVARGKAEVARTAPRPGEGVSEYTARALKAAYPCEA